ncbi:MAG: acyl-CoA dehydrogenase family protein [Minisyncoccota bacterium]
MSFDVQLNKKDHIAFRLSTRKFLQREVASHALEWETSGKFPQNLLKKCAKQGLLGLSFPKEVGGQAKDFAYEVILAEELASAGALGWALSILVQTNGVAPLIYELASEATKKKVLKSAFQGKEYLALAATEPGAGSDIAATETVAIETKEGFILNGKKKYITNGFIAGTILVLARLSNEQGIWPLGLFLVPGNSKGLKRERLSTIGFKTGDTAILHFDKCKVGRDALIGKPRYGFIELLKGLQRERLIGAIALNQVSRDTINQTRDMLRKRHRFGEALINKQVIRHRLAELSAEVEASRAFAYAAADAFIKGDSVDKQVVMLKIISYELCQRVIRECAHLWGGDAFLEGHWMASYYQDSLVFTLVAGSAEIMCDLLSEME